MNDQTRLRLIALLNTLEEGVLKEAQQNELVEILKASEEAQELYLHFRTLSAGLGDYAREGVISTDEELIPLTELARLEDAAEPIAVTIHDSKDWKGPSLSNKQWHGAFSYLYEHYITPRVIGGIAAAASLLLGAVLAIVVLSGPEEPRPTVEVPGFPDDVTPVYPGPNQVVAKVTDQYQAVWVSANGEGALPDRTLLGPNQRLTLSKGFAEITTVRGAKALLQSPCTIETTDSNNAIRLHRGKLVGICETQESKGFVVHAPGVDVVDLGTRFGVEADAEQGSTVRVLEGSVRAEPTPESPLAFEPVVLERDDARRIEPDTGGLEAIATAEAPVFYQAVPHPYVAAVLDAGPVVYWRFEDDQGSTVANEMDPDIGGLSVHGSAELTDQGILGRAARLVNLEKPYGYFETAEPIEALKGQQQYTVELWYYTDEKYSVQANNSTASLIVWYDPLERSQYESNNPLIIELLNDFWVNRQDQEGYPVGWLKDSIRVYPGFIGDSEPKRQLFTKQPYPVQKWQHLVLVKQEQSVQLFLDGRLVESIPDTLPSSNAPMIRLGRSIIGFLDHHEPEVNLGDHRSLRGRLDEVAIYDKPLTAEQVAKHYALATGRGSP